MSGSTSKAAIEKEGGKSPKKGTRKSRSSLSKLDEDQVNNKNGREMDKVPSSKEELEAEVTTLKEELCKLKDAVAKKTANIRQLLGKLKTSESQYNELKKNYDDKCKQACPNCQVRDMMQMQQNAMQQPQVQAPVWQPPIPQVPAWYQPPQPSAWYQPPQPPAWHNQPLQYHQGGYGFRGGRGRGRGQSYGWYDPY